MSLADAEAVPDRAAVARFARRQLAIAALAVGALAAAGYGSQISLTRLFDGSALSQATALMSGLLTPDLSPAFVTRVLRLTAESVAIGALGMLLALLLGIPLALLAARVPGLRAPPNASSWWRTARGGGRWLARSLLSALRAVPEIIWAYLFVRIFGLGPGPAVFAIGLSFAGIVGKLYAELIDACDPQPARALEAAGASRLTVLLHAILPQVKTQWVGYALFRFECAIRSAAILGVVGAGGLGSEIELSIRYFQHGKLATALLALLGCIVVMEVASAFLRRQAHATRTSVTLLAITSVLAFVQLDVDWSSLASASAAAQLRAFFAGFASPTHSFAALWHTLGLMLQTIAMAAFATASATIAALLLAPFASRVLTVGSFLRDGPRQQGALAVLGSRGILVFVRGVLQLLRALPELVWALLFVVWVGPGPFAGALAITAHTVGILGRLYGEVYEDAEALRRPPPQWLEASGHGRFSTWCHAVLPQCAPQLAAFALFRFEVNVRATAMVGFVAAGGIGDAIHTSISLFHMGDLALQLLVLLLAVIAVDILGEAWRRRLVAA